MKIIYNKKITCNDAITCSNDITQKIEAVTGKLRLDKDNVYGHVSISHVPNNHKIWLFLYDSDGIHESESERKDIKQNSNIVKKFKGIIPKKSQLESL